MLPPFADVSFARTAARLRPRRVRVMRYEYGHEVAVVRVREPEISAVRYRSDTPVRLTWGSAPNLLSRFVGYVHHIEADTGIEEDRVPLVDVYLVSATRAAFGDRARSWAHARTDQLVRQAARELRLGHWAQKSRRVLTNVMQHGDTWEFLAEKAREEGMVLYAEGATIYLVDPARVLELEGPTAPILSKRLVRSLRPVSGEHRQEDYEAAVTFGYGVNDRGELVAARDRRASTRDRRRALEPAPRTRRLARAGSWTSAGEIERDLQASVNLSRYVYKAVAEVVPSTLYHVTQPVFVRGHGDRYEGMWRVSEAEFELDFEQQELTAELLLRRFNTVDPVNVPSKAGQRSLRPPPVPVRFVNERWVAAVVR